ncbi:hypothetical protein MBLNU457_g0770t1 [Dothideomycetes sp. NU457]
MFRNVSTGSSTSRSGYSGGRYRGGSGRGRGQYRGKSGGLANTQEKGLFADGIWHCNCKPRLPAEHFRVKKEGKNHGRWFYTCQNAEPDRCGFFLWDEDAKTREETAVLNNSRSEPGRTQDVAAVGNGGAGYQPQPRAEKTVSPPPPYSSQQRTAQPLNPNKRKAISLDSPDPDEQVYDWPLTGQDEEELASVADNVPVTPHKATKTDAYATPATSVKRRQLPWLDYSAEQEKVTDGAATPTTSSSVSQLPTPSTKNTLSRISEKEKEDETPTPSRFKDALQDPSPAGSVLVNDVFSLLNCANVSLPANTEKQIKAVLTRHELKTQGVIKGREISRLGIKAKEAKIVELSARIASLEAEREVDRGVIKRLRERKQDDADVESGWSSAEEL